MFDQKKADKRLLKSELTYETLLGTFDKLISTLTDQEALFFKNYSDALNIDDAETMLQEQKQATIRIRSIKKWNNQLMQLRDEIAESGILAKKSEVDSESKDSIIETETLSLKIGRYVQERMRLLEQAGLTFTNEELNQMMDSEWSKTVLHLSKPFLKKCDLTKTAREQIADKTRNNRYWSSIFYFNDSPVFLCSQWYFSNKKYFDDWIAQFAERAGFEFPERTVIKDAPENKRRVHNKKDVNSVEKQKVGDYVQSRLRELEKIGISFRNDYLAQLLKEEWARKNLKLGFPFMKIVDLEKPIHKQIIDQKKKHRYWKKPFRFGNVDVLVCNEWHDYSRGLFDKWLKNLSDYIIESQNQLIEDGNYEGAVKLTITDYKLKKRR